MKSRIAIIAVIVLLVGWVAYSQWRTGALEVAAAHPTRGPLIESVEERATTRLANLHKVTMPQPALVKPETVEVGQQVKEGELLAQLDMRPLELAVKEAEAALEELDGVLAKSQDNSLENRVQQQSERLVESVAATVEAAEERVQAGQERADFSQRIRDRLKSVAAAASKNEVERAELQAVEAVSAAKQDQLIASASQAIQAATVLLPKMVSDFIDRKKLDDRVTDARKRAAAARLEQAQLQQRDGSLRSPVDGIVLESPIDTPQHLGFGETVFVVGQLKDLEIETDILSEDAVRINAGDHCVVFGPALTRVPEGRLSAVVERISPNAFMKVSSLGVEQQRVKVVIQLTEESGQTARQAGLGVGYQVDVRIVTGRQENALQVPRSALFRNQQDQWQVFVIEGGRAKRRDVTLGIQSETHAQVLSGLEETDLVIVEPESRIQEDVRVRSE